MSLSKLEILRKITRVLIVLVIFFTSTILITSFGYLFFNILKKGKGLEKISREYKYLLRNPRMNTTSRGVLSLFEEIEEEEYITFEDSSGNFHFVSNFGTTEYVCTGECYCETDEDYERRTSIALASKGLVYFLVAITSFSAMNKASEYFSKECQKALKDECPAVVSWKDEKCNQMTGGVFILAEEDTKDTENPENPDEEWYCSGGCVEKYIVNLMAKDLFSHYKEDIYKDDFPDGDSPAIILDRKFSCQYYKFMITIFIPKALGLERTPEEMEKEFVDKHLVPGCEKLGKFLHKIKNERSVEIIQKKLKVDYDYSFCEPDVGQRYNPHTFGNKRVVCFRRDTKSEQFNQYLDKAIEEKKQYLIDLSEKK